MGTSSRSRWRELLKKHRTRLSQVALVAFLVAVGLELGDAIPRSVEVDVPLGAQHARVTEAHIEYLREGETVRAVTRRFPSDPAPRLLRDSVELSPGDYDVAVLLVDRDGDARALRGRLTAPSDGVVRLSLERR